MSDPPPRDHDGFLAQAYAALRAIAQQRLLGERRDHTLQATALVHEAWLRLCETLQPDQPNAPDDHARFLAAASETMRRILIDHARARAAQKRGGHARLQPCAEAEPPRSARLQPCAETEPPPSAKLYPCADTTPQSAARPAQNASPSAAAKLPLDAVALAAHEDFETLLAVDEALSRLSQHDPDLANVVRLRFYAGLTEDEAAAQLGISPRTARRNWVIAKAWLRRELTE